MRIFESHDILIRIKISEYKTKDNICVHLFSSTTVQRSQKRSANVLKLNIYTRESKSFQTQYIINQFPRSLVKNKIFENQYHVNCKSR